MSDLGKSSQLARSTAQLPVSWYFDQAQLEQEIKLLFQNGPSYAGHELMVPEVGDFHSLPHENGGRMLVRGHQGIELLSNVCRHRQALMLNGRGSTTNIVCPLHRWTYDLQGRLLGAPYFSDNPGLDLERAPLSGWNGLLFENGQSLTAQLKRMGMGPEFNFEGYMYDHTEIHECDYNWKTFIEVYLEDYHVGPFHPGLGQFVKCDDLRWEFGQHYSVQTVGIADALARPGSACYRRWHDAVLKYRKERFEDVLPPYGAIWLTIYPNIMVEWYPHVLVVSTLVPRGPTQTTNFVEFYYPEEIVLFERDFIEAERAAYMETCAEDDEIARRMDAGRHALLQRGRSETGPYQSPMEDGMQHFHEWLRTELGSDHRR